MKEQVVCTNMNYDQTGHVFEFYYSDNSRIFVVEHEAFKLIPIIENVLYTYRDLIGYNVDPKLMYRLMGLYYKKMNPEIRECICVF